MYLLVKQLRIIISGLQNSAEFRRSILRNFVEWMINAEFQGTVLQNWAHPQSSTEVILPVLQTPTDFLIIYMFTVVLWNYVDFNEEIRNA